MYDSIPENHICVAIPTRLDHRTPIFFKWAPRIQEGKDIYQEEDGVSNSWPFDWCLIHKDPSDNVITGVNDNCGTSYRVFPWDENSRRKMIDYAAARTKYHSLEDGYTLSAVIEEFERVSRGGRIEDSEEKALQIAFDWYGKK